MPKYRIGCSGFLYDSWRGVFYPEDLPHKEWLAFYASKINSVELNVTFYRLLKKEAFDKWYRETPSDFSFVLKGSRFVTHIKKLKDVEMPLSTFFNITTPLGKKLEVVLWQFPPNLKVNLRSLEDFIEYLNQYPARQVFEFKNKNWFNKKVFKILSASNIAICMSDWPDYADEVPLTANFVYLYRQGEEGKYASSYTTEQLQKDAKLIKEYMLQGKDVYIYFNNDAFGYAPQNAMELRAILEKSLPKAMKQVSAEAGVPAPKKQKTKPAVKKAAKKKLAKKIKAKIKKKKPAVKKAKIKKPAKKTLKPKKKKH
jgi:uncharacterized protein YecE (DUF72 family)